MWGIYGLPQYSVEIEAFMQGLAYLGRPFMERNHNGFSNQPGQMEEFCPVVVSGLRDKGTQIRDAYRAAGVPVVVIDYGYLNRVSGIANFDTGYWQVGIDQLGWAPPFECPSDRFEALGLDIEARAHSGEAIYVCGQHAGDPSHGLDADGLSKWAWETVNRIEALTDRPVVWRPHPDTALFLDGVETHIGAVEWDDVFCVVTINSNIGREALLEGVPVVCDASASYADLGVREFSERLTCPPIGRRRSYFNRLAYAQWTLDEMREGLPVKWLESHGLTERKH